MSKKTKKDCFIEDNPEKAKAVAFGDIKKIEFINPYLFSKETIRLNKKL